MERQGKSSLNGTTESFTLEFPILILRLLSLPFFIHFSEAPAATAANAFEDEYSSENALLSQPVFHPPPPPSLPRRREDGAKRGQESSSTSETNLDSNKRRRESPPSNGTGKQGSARKARQESPNPANAKENNGTEPTFPVRHDRPSSVTAHSTHPTNKRKYTILPSFAKKKKKDATPYQKALRDDIVSAVNDLLSGSKIMAEDAMRKLHKMELQDIPKNEKLREMVIDAGALPAIFQAMTKFATNCEIQEIALALLSELGVVPGLLICEYGGIILTLKAMQLFPNQTDLQYNALHVLDNELNDGDGGVDERQQEIVSEFGKI